MSGKLTGCDNASLPDARQRACRSWELLKSWVCDVDKYVLIVTHADRLQAVETKQHKCGGAVRYPKYFCFAEVPCPPKYFFYTCFTSMHPRPLPLSWCLCVNTEECAVRAWKASLVTLLAFIWNISSRNPLQIWIYCCPPVCNGARRGEHGCWGRDTSRSQTEVGRCWCPRERHYKDCLNFTSVSVEVFL